MTVRPSTVRGIALPITLLVASIVVVLAAWMLAQGTQSLALVGNDNQGQASIYAAEAGLTFARATLAQTPSWGQPSPAPTTAGAPGTWDIVPPGASAVPYGYTGEDFQYTLTVTNNSGLNNFGGVAALVTRDGVNVPFGTAYVLSTAQTRTGAFKRSVGELVTVQPGLYQAGVESVGAVSFGGHASTGSYNSSGSATPDGGSVATVNGPLSFGGSTQVNGNLYGPGSSAYTSHITGQALPAPVSPAWTQLQTAPPGPGATDAPIPGGTFTLAPGTYANLSVSANDTVFLLAGGTYVFNDVSVSGGSQLAVPSPCTPPIKVFFYGSLSISGGSGTGLQNTVAGDLQFIQAGTSTTGRSVSISGGSDTVGVIDAPGLPISTGGSGNIRGAVVGASFSDGGNGQVIFDEALLTLGGNGASVGCLNYRRF